MTEKKLAIFVEGQTESLFCKKLLEEIAGKKSINFVEVHARHLRILRKNTTGNNEAKYFVLIVDCENDEQVKSRILESRENLIKSNYDLVLGLRDLYPQPRHDIERVRQGLKTKVPTKDLKIEICLAVMEIEAWFLQESTHFPRIDASLTVERIKKEIGFDPENDNAESVDHPADLLKDIYQLAGKSYTKSRKHVERTVNVLDYENVYFHLPEKLENFGTFLDYVDAFID